MTASNAARDFLLYLGYLESSRKLQEGRSKLKEKSISFLISFQSHLAEMEKIQEKIKCKSSLLPSLYLCRAWAGTYTRPVNPVQDREVGVEINCPD